MVGRLRFRGGLGSEGGLVVAWLRLCVDGGAPYRRIAVVGLRLGRGLNVASNLERMSISSYTFPA